MAAVTPMVDLGSAGTYAAISGASVGNTVSAAGAPHTTLRGDLGVKANTQPTGFPPGVVTGAIHVGDTAATQAHADLVTAYNEIASRLGSAPLAGALGGTTLTPGLYKVTGAVSNTTTVTLDAQNNPNAVFVFQVNGALDMAAGSSVVLTNGAKASRVFWQVNGAGSVGANANFTGTLIAAEAIAVGNGTSFNGRAFARNGALTLDANNVYSSPPRVAIDGGSTAITTDTTPTISGTTDVESPRLVTVSFAGQTLTAVPTNGAWSVTSDQLANGTYTATASATDSVGNVGSASQQLTIDTVLPVVTLDGGTSVTTNDPRPTISGTSDVAPGTVVDVTVDFQALTAFVQPGGAWNIRSASLADGAHTVTAQVHDPAGNAGTDDQSLIVDTTAPTATIDGGATRLTNDPTPTITGAADVAPGTQLSVDLADETLTGDVRPNGTWSVDASALSDGPHRIVMWVADGVGNRTTVSQVLTVDTVAPAVTITGGSTATTADRTPTLRGTSDAAPDTTVTVRIAGQTLTTLLQGGGAWNATPDTVDDGDRTVVASVADPAGNIGTATQVLTVGDAPPQPIATATPETTAPAPAAATASPTASPTATPAPAAVPAIVSASGQPGPASVTAGVLTTGAKIKCPAAATSTCAGSLLVYADATKRPKAKRTLIGRYTFKLKPGGTSSVRVRLSPKGKRRLARLKRVKATLVAITKDAAGKRVKTTSHLTLKLKAR